MKILFLSDQFPFPLHDGGNLRTFHVLQALASQHDVTIISHRLENHRFDQADFPIECRVQQVKRRWLLQRGLGYLRQGSSKVRSIFLAKKWSPTLLDAIDLELRSSNYDAIHFNHLDTACYDLVRDYPCFKVFDSHNCLSELSRRASLDSPNRLSAAVYRKESEKLASIETRICEQMDEVLACSTIDQNHFQRLCPTASVSVVPNGVDTEYFSPFGSCEQDPPKIVFTGAMNYFPNVHAATYFAREVLPQIKTPDLQVYFVGRSPSRSVLALDDGRRVFVTGEVDDVRPYVQDASVFIVPLKHGSGTRLKILEAFAMGKAVVSTSIGAEGIPASNGRELIVADTPETFASSVDGLLANARLRDDMGQAARSFVKKRFDWEQIQANVLDTYATLSEPRHASAR